MSRVLREVDKDRGVPFYSVFTTFPSHFLLFLIFYLGNSGFCMHTYLKNVVQNMRDHDFSKCSLSYESDRDQDNFKEHGYSPRLLDFYGFASRLNQGYDAALFVKTDLRETVPPKKLSKHNHRNWIYDGISYLMSLEER